MSLQRTSSRSRRGNVSRQNNVHKSSAELTSESSFSDPDFYSRPYLVILSRFPPQLHDHRTRWLRLPWFYTAVLFGRFVSLKLSLRLHGGFSLPPRSRRFLQIRSFPPLLNVCERGEGRRSAHVDSCPTKLPHLNVSATWTRCPGHHHCDSLSPTFPVLLACTRTNWERDGNRIGRRFGGPSPAWCLHVSADTFHSILILSSIFFTCSPAAFVRLFSVLRMSASPPLSSSILSTTIHHLCHLCLLDTSCIVAVLSSPPPFLATNPTAATTSVLRFTLGDSPDLTLLHRRALLHTFSQPIMSITLSFFLNTTVQFSLLPRTILWAYSLDISATPLHCWCRRWLSRCASVP